MSPVSNPNTTGLSNHSSMYSTDLSTNSILNQSHPPLHQRLSSRESPLLDLSLSAVSDSSYSPLSLPPNSRPQSLESPGCSSMDNSGLQAGMLPHSTQRIKPYMCTSVGKVSKVSNPPDESYAGADQFLNSTPQQPGSRSFFIISPPPGRLSRTPTPPTHSLFNNHCVQYLSPSHIDNDNNRRSAAALALTQLIHDNPQELSLKTSPHGSSHVSGWHEPIPKCSPPRDPNSRFEPPGGKGNLYKNIIKSESTFHNTGTTVPPLSTNSSLCVPSNAANTVAHVRGDLIKQEFLNLKDFDVDKNCLVNHQISFGSNSDITVGYSSSTLSNDSSQSISNNSVSR